METRSIPNFFIVGAPKCGTSSLAVYLAGHPSVFMCEPKEPGYFAADLPGIRQVDTLSAYLALFPSKGTTRFSVVGEASSLYLYSSVAIENIRAHNPEARLVVMLRNPVELVQSFHSQLLHTLVETEADFERAWNLQWEREGRPLLQYRRLGQLGAQMRRLYESWPDEQVEVVLLKDLRADTRAVYQRVLRHLRLEDDGRTDFPIVNANKINRSRRLARFARKTPKALAVPASLVKRMIGKEEWGIMQRLQAVNTRVTRRPSLRRAFRAELVDFFRDDLNDLATVLGRDLSAWG